MTREEILKLRPHYAELFANIPPMPPIRPKAKPEYAVKVSEKMDEAIKAQPESFRVVAKAANGTTLVERPTAVERLLAERAAQARAMQDAAFEKSRPESGERVGEPWQGEDGVRRAMVETYRPEGGREVGVVEFPGGYRLRPGARSEYNPMDGLKGRDDE